MSSMKKVAKRAKVKKSSQLMYLLYLFILIIFIYIVIPSFFTSVVLIQFYSYSNRKGPPKDG